MTREEQVKAVGKKAGARVSLVVGTAVALLGLGLGTTLGLVIGFYRPSSWRSGSSYSTGCSSP